MVRKTTYNETRAAKNFQWADVSFYENTGFQEMLREDLDHMRDTEATSRRAGFEGFASGNADPYRRRFAYRVLARQELDFEALDASQRLMLASVAMRGTITFKDPNLLEPMLLEWGEILLEWLATGRQSFVDYLAPRFMRLVTEGYYTRKVENRGPYPMPQKLGVFALEMLAAARNETIDWDSYKIPADRFWLDCARIGLTEPDPVKCAEWLRDLCQAHVESTNVAGDSGGTDVFKGHEIDDETHFLWPISVHAFLKLRRGLGLPEPAEIDHPLMRTSFAALNDGYFDEKRWKAEPWFIEAFGIGVELEPELEQIRGLVL